LNSKQSKSPASAGLFFLHLEPPLDGICIEKGWDSSEADAGFSPRIKHRREAPSALPLRLDGICREKGWDSSEAGAGFSPHIKQRREAPSALPLRLDGICREKGWDGSEAGAGFSPHIKQRREAPSALPQAALASHMERTCHPERRTCISL
jgi:hypothetical protein